MSPIYSAVMKFDPRSGDSWSRYIQWSGYHHIHEVVSVDAMLCPSHVDDLTAEDWTFNVDADHRTRFFRDYEYLAKRVYYDESRHNILALTEQPECPPKPPAEFTLCGYDILDSDNTLSVLLNCGEFPAIFTAADINRSGLLDNLNHALTVADRIRTDYTNDHHCQNCQVWAVSRYTQHA